MAVADGVGPDEGSNSPDAVLTALLDALRTSSVTPSPTSVRASLALCGELVAHLSSLDVVEEEALNISEPKARRSSSTTLSSAYLARGPRDGDGDDDNLDESSHRTFRFDFTDASECVQCMTVDERAIERVPYLQTLVSTAVGTQPSDRHAVSLPDGCAADACAALVLQATNQLAYAELQLVPDSLEAALVLLHTADFLCLPRARIEWLTTLCRRFVCTPEDLAALHAVRHLDSLVGSIVQPLEAGALVRAMSAAHMKRLCESMMNLSFRENYTDDKILIAQVKTLVSWLQVAGRNRDDVKDVLDGLKTKIQIIIWRRHSNGGDDGRRTYSVLSDAGLHLLAELAKAAVSRPQLMKPVFLCLTQASSDSDSPRVKFSHQSNFGFPRMLHLCCEPICAFAGQLSMRDVKNLLPFLMHIHLLRSPNCTEIILDILSRLLDHRPANFKELEVLMPLLLPDPQHEMDLDKLDELPEDSRMGPALLGLVASMLLKFEPTRHELLGMAALVQQAIGKVSPKDTPSLRPALPFKEDSLPVVQAFFEVLAKAEPRNQVDCIGKLTEFHKDKGRFRFEGFGEHWARRITPSTVSPLCREAQATLFAALIGNFGNEGLEGDVHFLSAEMGEYIVTGIMNDEL